MVLGILSVALVLKYSDYTVLGVKDADENRMCASHKLETVTRQLAWFSECKEYLCMAILSNIFSQGRGRIVCLCLSLMPSVVSEHPQNFSSIKGS